MRLTGNNLIRDSAGSLRDRLNTAGQSISAFWAARDARERKLLTIACAVILFGLIYGLLFGPAMAGREQLNQNLPVLRQQAAQLQAMARELAGLTAQTPPPIAPLGKENLERTLAAKGLKAENLAITGELAKVQLSAVSFTDLLQWLDDIRKTTLVVMVDANIVALPQPDTVNATLTLRQTRNE
jgi:general secretion pathway protein M